MVGPAEKLRAEKFERAEKVERAEKAEKADKVELIKWRTGKRICAEKVADWYGIGPCAEDTRRLRRRLTAGPIGPSDHTHVPLYGQSHQMK